MSFETKGRKLRRTALAALSAAAQDRTGFDTRIDLDLWLTSATIVREARLSAARSDTSHPDI